MSDSLNRYMEKSSGRRFKVPLAWRLCVSHPFRVETDGDSCNSVTRVPPIFTKRTQSYLCVRRVFVVYRKICETKPLPSAPCALCLATEAVAVRTGSGAKRYERTWTSLDWKTPPEAFSSPSPKKPNKGVLMQRLDRMSVSPSSPPLNRTLWLALIAFALLTWCSTSQAALVGYWNFNEGSGLTATDTAGYTNANNGTLLGGAETPAWVSGRFGSALGFT